MAHNEGDIEIRSDEVQEILSHTPNWMIRWGISSIFFLLFILIGISFFIKYPDVIQGQITLTTEVPPVKLVSKTSGQLASVYVQDGKAVKKNDFVADIKSPLTDTAVTHLKKLMASIKAALASKTSSTIDFSDGDLVFGEIQNEYGQLKVAYSAYHKFKTNSYRSQKEASLQRQINSYKELLKISSKQLQLSEANLSNAQAKFLSEKNLFEKGVISKMEFYGRQTAYNQQKQQVEAIRKTKVENGITINAYQKELFELQYETEEKGRTLEEGLAISCENIENFLNMWEQNFRLTAPFDGKLTYLSMLSENQFVKAGAPLFAVIPNNTSYIGAVQIPSQGFGKVEVGQTVHIKLNNYPSNEFGQLEGVVVDISLLPTSSSDGNQALYLAKVELINGLTTTYNKQLAFTPEMLGSAEIITEDLRLIERIFNQFRKLMDS